VGGYQLDLISTLNQFQVPTKIKTFEENAVLVSLEVTNLLANGAIVKTNPSADSFVSQVFLAEMKDGGQRPVINMKGLNQFVRGEHFKMEVSKSSISRGLNGKN